MSFSKNYLEFKNAEILLNQVNCVQQKHGFYAIHKAETLIQNKEDKEMKFLLAYIFYHMKKQQFIVLITSKGVVKHQMLI